MTRDTTRKVERLVHDAGAWRQIPSVWRGLESPRAKRRLLLLALVVSGIIACNTLGQIRLNAWQGSFFNAIGARDLPAFLAELKVFALIVSVLLVLVVAQTWLVERIKLRLRSLLTLDLLDTWLAPRRAYLLQMQSELGDHPDQRVHEDCRHLAELATDLTVGLLQSTLLLASFTGVLWTLSSDMAIPVAGRSLSIPGYMVWCALAYSLAGSLLTWVVGRPLIRLNAERYEQEGAFRLALLRVGEGARTIALHRGEADEQRAAGGAFEAVQATGFLLAGSLAKLTWITSAYGWGTLVAPVVAAMPAYFAGSLSLGGLMMVVGAFGQVQQALRWFVDNFPRIADCEATLGRVLALRNALALLNERLAVPGIRIEQASGDAIELDELVLALPNGTATLEGLPTVIRPGERVLITGGPGAGKSTLILALAGLWSAGSGRVGMPPPESTMFLPQQPYLKPGTLRQAIEPAPPGATDGEIGKILSLLDLGHLRNELARSGRWDRELSLDEQQGLQLARLLLNKPAWVFMDDAVSAFDERRRKEIYIMLAHEMPKSAFIGTSRTAQPNGFWTRILHLRHSQDRGRQTPLRREGPIENTPQMFVPGDRRAAP